MWYIISFRKQIIERDDSHRDNAGYYDVEGDGENNYLSQEYK